MRQEAWNPGRSRSIKTIGIVAALAVGVMLLIGAATMFGSDDKPATTAQSAAPEPSGSEAGVETTVGRAGGSTGTLVPTTTPTTSRPSTSSAPTTGAANGASGATATRTVTVTPPPAAVQPNVSVGEPQVGVSNGGGGGGIAVTEGPQPSVSVDDVPLSTTAIAKPAPAMFKGCEQTGSRVIDGVKLTGVSEVCAREKNLAAPFVDPDAARKVASVLEGKAPSSVLRAKFVREATARTSVPVAVGDQYVLVDFNG